MQTTAAMGDDRISVMVALVPSESASKALLEHASGTEPLDEQHVTLCLLDIEDNEITRDAVRNTVGSIATLYAGMNGEVSGYGVFRNEQDALVALWSIPGVNGLRQRIVTDLRDVGMPIRSDYGFTPHQTLAYTDPADDISIPSQRGQRRVKSNFTEIIISWGDEGSAAWEYFRLSGVRHEASSGGSIRHEAAPARGGNPDNPGQFSSEDKGYRKKQKSPSSKDESKADESKADESKADESKKPQKPAGDAQSPSADSGASEAENAQESSEQPLQEAGYTGTTYDASKTFFTEEERIAHGDQYGKYLPEGKYPEGDPRNEPEFDRIMAEKTELTNKYVAVTKEEIDAGATEGGETEALYDRLHDPETGKANAYRPERARHHQEILKRMTDQYRGYPRNGKAVVMAGPPGAGKSTALKNYGSEAFGIEMNDTKADPSLPPAANYVTINPDDFKEMLDIDASRYPGLEENELAAMLHEESSYVAKMATNWFMSRGYDCIIDITLGSASSAQRKYYDDFADSYDYQVLLVDGDMANSRNNAGLRYKQPDKETGVRSYGGRFLPMALIEHNAPTRQGFRSRNAEQFLEFINNDKVSNALVYDPYNADAGLQEASTAKRLAEASLSGMLGVLKEARGMQETEITEKIKTYKDGQIQQQELVDFLVNYKYKPNQGNPHRPGSPQWWDWAEDKTDDPGTYDEVNHARDIGLLDWETYHMVNDAIAKASPRY